VPASPRPAVGGRGRQDRGGLGADVAGTARGPVKERVRDLIERVVAAQVGTGRGDAAMHIAVCVSSLYSPGAYGPRPPPFITGISSDPRT
jgi:hypothetical protein